jgi:hypothetical protein
VSETVRAELAASAEAVDRYRHRIAGLIDTLGTDSEDLASAMYEAERALLSAHRLLLRAEKIAK